MADVKKIAIIGGSIVIIAATAVAISNAQKIKNLQKRIKTPDTLEDIQKEKPLEENQNKTETPTVDIFNVILEKVKSIFAKKTTSNDNINSYPTTDFVGQSPKIFM